MSRIETARRLLGVDRPREALDQLRRELEQDPEAVEAWRLLSFVHVALDEPEQALRASEQALRLAPDDAWVLYSRAYALGASGRVREALDACEEAIGCDASADAFHSYRAALLETLGRREEALSAVDEALALDPEDAYALDLRIGLLRKLHRKAEAESMARHALSLHPERAEFHEHLGRLALSDGDAKRAWADFREALRLAPASLEAKSGVVDALRARSPVYRRLFSFAEWSRRAHDVLWSRRAKSAYAIYAVLAVLSFSVVPVRWAGLLLLPLFLAYFLVLAWLGVYVLVGSVLPLFLVGAWFDPFGRHALKDTLRARWKPVAETQPARFRWRSWLWLLVAPYMALPLLIVAPIVLSRRCRPGRARTTLLAASAVQPLVVVGVLAWPDLDVGHPAIGVVAMAAVALVLAIAALVVRRLQDR